jgi:HK97 gp10 family phage protein
VDFSTKLTGFKELADALRELPGNLGKNVLRSAVGAGAAVVRVEAKKNADAMRVTGTLARAIYQKQIPEQSGPEKQVFYVGARQVKLYQKVGNKGVNKDAYYARWVELGHFSRPAGGGKLPKNTNRGERNNAALASQVQAGSVHWVPAHPFLRPAFDVQKDHAVDAIGDKIRARLETIKVGK